MNFVSRQFPENIAVVLEDGQEIRYRELHAHIQDAAKAFLDKGVVFCLCDNDYPSLLVYLGALESGSIPFLLNSTIQEDLLNVLIGAYQPRYIFHKVTFFAGKFEGILIRRFGEYEVRAFQQPNCYKLNAKLALLLATSGSTGSPKLLRLSGQNIISNADSIIEYLNIDATERAITSLPISYSYGLSVVNTHLRAGASLVLTNKSLLQSGFWKLIQNHKATSFAGVPYSYEILLKLGIARLDVPSLKTMTQAGGKLSPDKIRKVHEACLQKGIRFVSMYGQTEATARMAYLPPVDTLRKLGSIGIAIPGGRLWIEDESGKTICDSNVTGELIFEGPNVSLGYAESYSDLALDDVNCGRLRTGDLASRDDEGYLYIEGRKSRFLKLYGVRVSLDGVEKILTGMHVEGAAGGADDHLVVSVVNVTETESESLRDRLSEILRINKAALQVRSVSELPRLASGKIDYHALNKAI